MIILQTPDGRSISAASISGFVRNTYGEDPIASQIVWDEKEGKYILQIWHPGYCICLGMPDEEDSCPVWAIHPKDCPMQRQRSADADILCRHCVLSDAFIVDKYDSLEDLF